MESKEPLRALATNCVRIAALLCELFAWVLPNNAGNKKLHPRLVRLFFMGVIVVTGSGGLVGGAAVDYFCEKGFDVIGIDNDMRKWFYGEAGSTALQTASLSARHRNFTPHQLDIRDMEGLTKVFESLSAQILAVIHCAAQPSHDWAARDPITDFSINATGTLHLLELTRRFSFEAAFIFMSTNKVYGDSPNRVELEEVDTRWTPTSSSLRFSGFDETLTIDQSTHSLFGVSKASADLLVQEYGRYFGMNTAVFRGGCLTGPNHAGVELHGFLSYLVKCTVWGRGYTIFGHKGKQVRDNIHTKDLVRVFAEYIENPMPGEVFNIGGGLQANVSMFEAIQFAERLSGKKLDWRLGAEERVGDHRWYVSDLTRVQNRFPDWTIDYDIELLLSEMVSYEEFLKARDG